MRILIVLVLLGLFALVLYRLLRPYLKLVKQFIQTVRHFQNLGDRSSAAGPRDSQKLIQCATCGTWIPQSRALSTRRGEFCSDNCRSRAQALRDER